MIEFNPYYKGSDEFNTQIDMIWGEHVVSLRKDYANDDPEIMEDYTRIYTVGDSVVVAFLLRYFEYSSDGDRYYYFADCRAVFSEEGIIFEIVDADWQLTEDVMSSRFVPTNYCFTEIEDSGSYKYWVDNNSGERWSLYYGTYTTGDMDYLGFNFPDSKYPDGILSISGSNYRYCR